LIPVSAQTELDPPAHSCHQVKNQIFQQELSPEEEEQLQKSLERSDTFDILHYDIHANLTQFDQGIFNGDTQVDFSPKMDSLDRIQFDFEGLSISSITDDTGTPLSFEQGDAVVTVFSNQPYRQDSSYSLRFQYSGNPITCPSGFGGFYFEQGYAYNLGIGLQAKPHNFGRAWYPCFDNFVERATYTFRITTHQGRKGYGVGTFMSETAEGGDTLTRIYEMMQEIPTYLSHIAASEYEEVNYMHQGQYAAVPIQLIARGPDTAFMRESFEPLADALDCLEDWYGPYAFERVGYTITTRGAMEHPTAVAYPRSSIANGSTNLGLITHELGHHWWGNVTTLKTENDMWIKEGPASYAEHQIVEYLDGPKAFQDAVRSNNINMIRTAHIADGDFLALSPMDDAHIYGRHTYDKGAAMIHNLRGYLGDSLFRLGMQNVLEEKAFQAISGPEFRDQLTQATGYDLTAFFDDWIFKPGWSDFYIQNWSATPLADRFQIDLTVRQDVYGTDELHREVPLTFGFYSEEEGLVQQRANASGRNTTLAFDIPFEPEYVFVNPEQQLNLASASHFEHITPSFQPSFPGTEWIVDLSGVNRDTLPFQLTHHFIPPDGQNQEEDFRLSTTHFWSVWTPEPEPASDIIISYRGSNSDQLDYDLVQSTEDSLILVHRPFGDSLWRKYEHYEKNIQLPGSGRGIMEVSRLKSGHYAFANERQTTSSPVAEQSPAHLFPNPAAESTSLLSPSDVLQYRLVNASGQTLREIHFSAPQRQTTIDVSLLNSGVYFLHWKDIHGQNYSQKLIRQ
jgi:aminopeptidase N